MIVRFRSWWEITRYKLALIHFTDFIIKRNEASWWRENRRTLITGSIVVCILVVFVFIGYQLQLHWMGFDGGYNMITTQNTAHGVTTIEQHQPAKNLWDWLQLLFIPAVIAFGGLWFTQSQRVNEKKVADKRAENDREIARDNQQESALHIYLDKMSELLFEQNLRTSQHNDEARMVARARTLATLRGLDDRRKGSLIQFLYESELINKSVNAGIINLVGADLSNIHLFGANLSEVILAQAFLFNADLGVADLHGANLSKAILNGAHLNSANLSKTDLHEASLIGSRLAGANLSEANLNNAQLGELKVGELIPGWDIMMSVNRETHVPDKITTLNGANLTEAKLENAQLRRVNLWETLLVKANLHHADLSQAQLWKADLRGANLSEANLSKANLTDARLTKANLRGAILSNANLRDADLEETNLSGTDITPEQLGSVKSLKGAIMPDGSIHP